MFDKLEAIEKTYDDLTEQMTDPGVIGDQTRYTKVAKQHRDLEPVVEEQIDLARLTAQRPHDPRVDVHTPRSVDPGPGLSGPAACHSR